MPSTKVEVSITDIPEVRDLLEASRGLCSYMEERHGELHESRFGGTWWPFREALEALAAKTEERDACTPEPTPATIRWRRAIEGEPIREGAICKWGLDGKPHLVEGLGGLTAWASQRNIGTEETLYVGEWDFGGDS